MLKQLTATSSKTHTSSPCRENDLTDMMQGSLMPLRDIESYLPTLDDANFVRVDSNRSGISLRALEMRQIQSENVYSTPDTFVLDIRRAESSIPIGSSDNYAKWKTLTLVAKSISKFRSLKAEKISSIIKLQTCLSDVPVTETKSSSKDGVMYITRGQMYNNALDSFRDHTAFFKALNVASKEDLAEIKKALHEDPKRNLYDAESSHTLANKPNHIGQTPLYIACRNGNLELVKLLIQFKANPYQLCNITSSETESNLAVAARWGHAALVHYLLSEEFLWSEKELRNAFKDASVGTKRIIQLKIKIEDSFLKKLFCCCPHRKNPYLSLQTTL